MNCFQSAIPILKALCDVTRLKILTMLSKQEMSGCEINRAFACTQPTISYHMKLLSDTGLVNTRREGCQVFYTVNDEIWPSVEALLTALCRAQRCAGEEKK